MHQTTSEQKTSQERCNSSGTFCSHLALGQIREPLENISPHTSSSLFRPSLPLSASSITAFASQSANPCKESVSPAASLTNQGVSSDRVGGLWLGPSQPSSFSLPVCASCSWTCSLTHASWIHSHAKAQKSRYSLRHRASCSILNHNQIGLKISVLLLWNAADWVD